MTRHATAIACSNLVPVAFEDLPVRPGAELEAIPDGLVAWEGDALTYVGPRSGWDGDLEETFEGCTVVPGFVDCHTHLPFFGWRDDEYEARLSGATYRDQHGEGGIARSARMLAEATDDEILDFCRPLAQEMLALGTTALELKTGYGLSVEAELRQARLARRLAEEIPQTAVVTLLACHAVPPGSTREAWMDAVCDELLPRVTQEGLADAVDAYVEDIAFSVEDLERVARAADDAGLPVRVHADQLGATGATEAAVRLGARSADHLNRVSGDGVRALGSSDAAAVLLPASTVSLGTDPPPVGALRDAGAAMAVATDFNPGTSAVLSMPEAIALGCARYRLTPSEALIGATVNAAWVLGLHDALGSLAPGHRADLVVLDAPHVRMVPYRPGHDPVVEVVAGGLPVGSLKRGDPSTR